jgi:pimeloyl-ACP methyl ester carboxylesterase
MRGRRDHWSKAGAATLALALLVVGAVVAQDPAPPDPKAAAPAKDKANANAKDVAKDKDNAKASSKKGRLLKAPARTPNKGIRKAVDPLAAAPTVGVDGVPLPPGQPLPPPGTFHYRFKIALGEGEPLSAAYYPSKVATNPNTPNTSPVVLLVHERERSSKDFEEPIAELGKVSLAVDLQKQGFVVLAVDYRGHGASTPRRTIGRSEFPAIVNDLQLAYYCLVDRHNWGELNVAKLGVVAVGEGANVAATWAALGGAVSSEGRTSDLNALVLISPMVDGQNQGVTFKGPITALAARVSLDLLVGERDTASFGLVDDGPASVKAIVKRYRSNRVETFPSALHGYKLLQFEPNLTQSIFRFLEGTIKAKSDEWDGRYLLTPVAYSDVKIIKNPVKPDPAAAAAKKAAN